MISWSSSSSNSSSNVAMMDNDEYGDVISNGKDGMSSPTSLHNGVTTPGGTIISGTGGMSNGTGGVIGGVDSLSDSAKKKKGPPPRQQEELCLVCGDRASGYHYNALTCEGCKGFFRRSITKNAVYQCKYGNNCEIDMYMRRKCQECRLKKCLSVGMRPECVVPEYQCAIKRESKRAQKEKDKPNSTTKGDGHHHHHHHHNNNNNNHITSITGNGIGSPDKDEKPCIRSIHASMSNGTSGLTNGIHSSTTSSTTNSHLLNHNNNHHHQNNHNNSHNSHHNHNNHHHISSNNVVNSSSSSSSGSSISHSHHHNRGVGVDNNSTTGSPTSLSNISSLSTTSNNGNHHPINNGLHTTNGLTNHHNSVNHNNNSIRLNNNNNNKILTSNDRILNLGIKPMSADQTNTISKLVGFQEEFDSPADDDVRKITPFTLGDSEEDSRKRFQHVTEMTILTVQLIVEFSKRVPGFETLMREDQITLLKACSSEIMMLRSSRKYDIKTDTIVYANNQPYTRENYRSASIGDLADSMFNFGRMMCLLRVDNAEYSLITAIIIFSERPHLRQPEKIERIQEFYLETLKAYVENHRPPDKCYFAKLLSILTELRSLGTLNADVCFSLKVQNKQLPPFLAEIWDVQA